MAVAGILLARVVDVQVVVVELVAAAGILLVDALVAN